MFSLTSEQVDRAASLVVWCRWDKCWIRFLDGMLQTSILHSPDFQLRIPVGLRHVAILDAATPLPAASAGTFL